MSDSPHFDHVPHPRWTPEAVHLYGLRMAQRSREYASDLQLARDRDQIREHARWLSHTSARLTMFADSFVDGYTAGWFSPGGPS